MTPTNPAPGTAATGNRWNEYQDVLNPTFYAYLPYESAVTRIRAFQPRAIHGLLQTEAYARTMVHDLTPPDRPADVIARQITARVARQTILEQPDRQAQFILDEAALWRGRGGQFDEALMDEQLRRLHELAARPHITIQYLPWHHEPTASMVLGSFNLLDVPPLGHQIVYLERSPESSLADDPAKVTEYVAAFDELASMASSIRDFTYTAENRVTRRSVDEPLRPLDTQ